MILREYNIQRLQEKKKDNNNENEILERIMHVLHTTMKINRNQRKKMSAKVYLKISQYNG